MGSLRLCWAAVTVFSKGHYGLPAEQLLDARVVLANGSAVTVSADSHADLFWALRGAGQNFGIVTEFTYRIYDIPEDDEWFTRDLVFTSNRLERVFAAVNGLTTDKSGAQLIDIWPFYLRLPDVDAVYVRPLVQVYIDGSKLMMEGSGRSEDCLPRSGERYTAHTYAVRRPWARSQLESDCTL